MSRIDDLIAAGFQQVSRKYRMLARLPPGMTGLEALATVDPQLAAHMLLNANRQAAEQYMRVYAKGPDQVTLTEHEFDEYLGKTGRGVPTRPALVQEARKALEDDDTSTPTSTP